MEKEIDLAIVYNKSSQLLDLPLDYDTVYVRELGTVAGDPTTPWRVLDDAKVSLSSTGHPQLDLDCVQTNGRTVQVAVSTKCLSIADLAG